MGSIYREFGEADRLDWDEITEELRDRGNADLASRIDARIRRGTNAGRPYFHKHPLRFNLAEYAEVDAIYWEQHPAHAALRNAN